MKEDKKAMDQDNLNKLKNKSLTLTDGVLADEA